MREFLSIIKETFQEWSKDKAFAWAAALAYFTIFSIAPLLLITISIVGLVVGQRAAEGQVFSQIEQLVGPQAAPAVEQVVRSAAQRQGGIIGVIVGTLVLLWGASNVFKQLQLAVDTMWDIEPKPGGGVIKFIKTRVVSVIMVLSVGMILLASLALTTALSALWSRITEFLPQARAVLPLLDLTVSFLVVGILFTLIFKLLPHASARWPLALLGAAVTSFLFAIGKFLVGIYLGQANVASSYGSLGSLVVFLLWINYSAQIFLLGAEFIDVYARHHGQEISPNRDGIKVKRQVPAR